MIVKVFKVVWFFSLLATMTVFLYVYASLPEDILVWGGEVPQFISRNGLFYSGLALLAIINALIFIVSRLYDHEKNAYFLAWLYGLVGFLNLFLVVTFQFISLYNSQEKFNYDSIGYIVYGSVGLVVIWSGLWPVYFIGQRFFNKQSI